MGIKNFFSPKKPCKYVHNILISSIFVVICSLMFIHVITYKTHLFSKYLKPLWVPRTVNIKGNKTSPHPIKTYYLKAIQAYK